jgi:hypothetical protein
MVFQRRKRARGKIERVIEMKVTAEQEGMVLKRGRVVQNLKRAENRKVMQGREKVCSQVVAMAWAWALAWVLALALAWVLAWVSGLAWFEGNRYNY